MPAAIRPSGPSRPHVVRRRARASALLLALVLAVLGAAPAQAHDVLVPSSPVNGDASGPVVDGTSVTAAVADATTGPTTEHGDDHQVLGGHGEHLAMGAGAVVLALLGVGGVVLRRRRD